MYLLTIKLSFSVTNDAYVCVSGFVVGSLPASRVFYPGSAVFPSPEKKNNTSKLQFDLDCS